MNNNKSYSKLELNSVIKRFDKLYEKALTLGVEYKFLKAISIAFECYVTIQSKENFIYLMTLNKLYSKFIILKSLVLLESD